MTSMKCLFALAFLLAVLCRGMEAKNPTKEKNSHDVKDAMTMSDKELESFLRQKATGTIQKMKKQFKDAYTNFVSTKAKTKKVQAEHKLEELIDQANAKVKEDINDSTKGLKVQVTPLHGKEAIQAMVSVQRTKRSGVCRSWCKHKCLPSCNLACCVPPPSDSLTKEEIENMEDKAAWKMSRKKKDKISRVPHSHKANKHVKKAKEESVVSEEENNQDHISKEDMEKGEVCESKCRVLCLPTCKFKCCITTYN